MSFTDNNDAAYDPEDFDDEFDDLGQDGGADQSLDANPSEDPFDIDQFGDRFVTVKVDGQDTRVTVKEAISGYQRQADYTRKTQEIAQQRQDLQVIAAIKQSLDTDPVGTVKLLAEHYGVEFGTAPSPQTESRSPWEDDYDPWSDRPQAPVAPVVDPRVDRLEQRFNQIDQQAQRDAVQAEINRLSNTYPDFDTPSVIARAIQLGTTDLEAVHKSMAYDRMVAEQQARAAKRAQKRAAQDVSGGDLGGRGKEEVGEIRTVADAFYAAKRELGIS